MKTWTDEQLRAAVAQSRNISQVLRILGLRPVGGNYETIRRRLAEMIAVYAVDTSHFRQTPWNKGMRFGQSGRPLAGYLVKGSTCKSSWLRVRLIAEGLLDPECTMCGGRTWQGVPIPLKLEHKNGDRNDNRLENLALLCPNCHALTPTYRGRNIGRYNEDLA